MKTITTLLITLFLASGILCCGESKKNETETVTTDVPEIEVAEVLVFSKTAGYRHESIEKGVATLREIGNANGIRITHTEDSLVFSTNNLKKYQLVVFLSTTMDVLGPDQQQAFENYIKAGGAYMGIHAAADTEYDWPWFGKLTGAWFKSHPEQQEARIMVADQTHPATKHLGESWMHFDEWYNYKDISPDIQVLMKLDESTYTGGENGDNHPIAWYQEYDGGRAFYTGLGHTEEAFDDPDFRQHLLGGIQWCIGIVE